MGTAANDQECDTVLGLGIRGHYYNGGPSTPNIPLDLLPLTPLHRDSCSLEIFPCARNSSDQGSAISEQNIIDANYKLAAAATCCSNQYDDTHNSNNMVSSANSNVSSFHVDYKVINHETSYGVSTKRKREDFEAEKSYCRVSDEEEEGGGTRKKLRLSKDQSALLEESFKDNSTLNTKQKQDLAMQLNLRPRQVEVWFQNRRARTKLKQTEVDCEFLKGCYESLTEENKRLHKELAELRSLKLAAAAASPVYMQLPAATLSMCPSCQRVITSDHNFRSFTSLPKPHLYPSYTQSSSVAC